MQNVSKRTASWTGWVILSEDFRGEGVVPGEYFFVSRKPDTFWYLHRAACSRFDTILACDRRTDRRTELL